MKYFTVLVAIIGLVIIQGINSAPQDAVPATDDMKVDMPDNMAGEMEGNMADGMPDDMKGDMKDDMAEDMKDDMAGDMKDDKAGNKADDKADDKAATTTGATSKNGNATSATPTSEAKTNGADDKSEEAFVKADVVEYLNNKIKQLLKANPEKNPIDIKLAGEFNKERSKLMEALIKDPPKEGDDVKVEEALDSFKKFMQQYKEIEEKLNKSLDELKEVEDDANTPVMQKYEALMLVLKLKDSETLKEVQKALKQSMEFSQNIRATGGSAGAGGNAGSNTSSGSNGGGSNGGGSNGSGSTVIAPPSPSFPDLTDEYRNYFEQILQILMSNNMLGDPQMQNFLQTILKNPKQLKKLAQSLFNLTDDDNSFFSFFDIYDLFSFF